MDAKEDGLLGIVHLSGKLPEDGSIGIAWHCRQNDISIRDIEFRVFISIAVRDSDDFRVRFHGFVAVKKSM